MVKIAESSKKIVGTISEKSLPKVAVIGSYVPKKCGIATFTNNLITYMQKITPMDLFVVAAEEKEKLSYGSNVKIVVDTASKESYLRAAEALRHFKPDVILLQHEYGIYGGKWANFRIKGMDYRTPTGNYLLDLLEGVNAPIITTLHTVLPHLDAERSKVLAEIAARSCKIILMTEQSKGVIIHQWPAIARKTTFIPHGVELKEKNEARSKILKRLKLPDDKFYLMVSGLIGPNKNIEAIIKTLPDLVAEYPQIQLLVVGQTHPQIIKNAGEQYRKSLKKLARDLGVSQHVRFVNKYISSELLLDYLAISDVYLTIHNDPEQSASGTLAYAVGNGLVSISTPYAYARELLSKNRGLLVPFNNSEAIGAAIILLITNQRLYKTIRLNATKYGKEMGWDRVAEAYWKIIDDALPKSV